MAAPAAYRSIEGEFVIRTARTFRERLAGLIGRPPPAPGEALLIPRCRSVHTVGMRCAIDIAFVRAEAEGLRVLAVRERVRPFRLAGLRGETGEIGALELAAGEARRLRLRPGSSLPAARFL